MLVKLGFKISISLKSRSKRVDDNSRKIKLENLALPPFMDDYQKYLAALDVIAKTNGIDSYVLKYDLGPCLPSDIMTRLPVNVVPHPPTRAVLKELLALRKDKEKDAGDASDNPPKM